MVIYLIRDYEIKKINNDEILYVYIDYNSEFAKIKSKRKQKKFKKYLEEFIKRNNIDFKGTTIALMAGGVMIGTIILNKPVYDSYYLNKMDNYVVSLVSKNNDVLNKETLMEDEINKDVQMEEKTIKNEFDENIVKDNSLINEKINDNETNNIVQETNNNIVEETENNNIQNDNNTYVTIYRSNGTIINVELEDYLIGVVAAEMPASFNMEALKAQAVLARTYTLKSIKTGKILTDNSTTQNYKDDNELKNIWGNNYNTYINKVKNAVESTKGLYLSYNNDYIEAVYHSTSNGKTENSVYVWGNSFPYLVSVDSPYDNTNKTFLSTIFLNNETLTNKLGQVITSETIYNIITRNESGRVDSIAIDNIIYTGVELRNKLGLRSTDFEIEIVDNGVNFITKGYGHGVGMSQYGANGMANNGYNFKEILTHYYTGVSINYKE